MPFNVSPWQQKIFAQWQHFIQMKKMPQALLLHGAQGLAKAELVRAMLAFLWCSAPEFDLACGHCRHCHWWSKEGLHPDCFWLKPDAPGKIIKIDSLREACAWLQLSPLNVQQKALVIESAEQLNIAASNALLKTLEEPQESSIIILISAIPEQLLPTLRSRCYKLPLHLPDESFTRAWLKKQMGGAAIPNLLPSGLGPYALLAACSEEQLKKETHILEIIHALLDQKIFFLAAAQALKEYAPQEILRYLYFFLEQEISACYTQNNLMALQQWLKFEQTWIEVKRSIVQNTNLNWLLQLELLLADMSNLKTERVKK